MTIETADHTNRNGTDLTTPLSSVTAQLVDQLVSGVERLRRLQQQLNHGEVHDSELRHAIGGVLHDGREGLITARGFHHMITALEHSSSATLESMVAHESILSVVQQWMNDLQQAADTVIGELVAIDSIALAIRDNLNDCPATVDSMLTVISQVCEGAIERLDRAQPPNMTPQRT